jgi:hypothetical protein
VLQIQIGPRKDIAADDELGRPFIGWFPGMTEAEAWEVSRGVWKFKADRALEEHEAQIVNTEGTVLAVARITGISKCEGGRYALEGELLAGDPRVGQLTPTPHPSRNPVAYV